MPETFYLAIYQDNEKTVALEYIPLGEGCIEIVSVHVAPRPLNTIFEQRKRRGYLVRRGIER